MTTSWPPEARKAAADALVAMTEPPFVVVETDNIVTVKAVAEPIVDVILAALDPYAQDRVTAAIAAHEQARRAEYFAALERIQSQNRAEYARELYGEDGADND